jgi:transcriptional regulator with XRE-family HTH domain
MQQITNLRDETRKMLINRPEDVSLNYIADKLDVSATWLSAFARGIIKNPGVVTIETLYCFLKRI